MSPHDLALPGDFDGRVRLFPLPNVVLFPHVMQPLHIFEPRYKALMDEALHGDRLIALAALAPGWEKNYEGRPEIFPIACLGRVTTHQQLPDGRYNFLLLGIRRVRIKRELPPDKPFREAEVEVLEDRYQVTSANRQAALREKLVQVMEKLLHKLPQAKDQLTQLFDSPLPLGVLADIVGHTLALSPAFKLELLAQLDADRRATMLLDSLVDSSRRPEKKFPPDVSMN